MKKPTCFALSLVFISLIYTSVLTAQPYVSSDATPSFDIVARIRNGNTGFEAVLFTPNNPSPTGVPLNPNGAPIWNTNGNTYGTSYFNFKITYTASTGNVKEEIDFNHDNDYLDAQESASSTTAAFAGKSFEYIQLRVEGSGSTADVDLDDFTINSTNFGSYTTSGSSPSLITTLYEETSGLFGDITITGTFTFTANGGSERPRIWVSLGSPKDLCTAPSITCPSNINIDNTTGECGANVTFEATATGTSPSITYSPASGSFFAVGTTTVTATATNSCGTDECTFTVTVNDVEKPVANCKNYTLTLSGGAGTLSADDVNNGSADNCGIANISVSPNTFSCSDIGDQTVTLTVTDVHNNVSTCDATVTVVGSVPTCTLSASVQTITFGYGSQTSTITATPSGGSSFTYEWTGSNLTGSGSSVVFSPTSTGTYTIGCTVTNEYGCSSSCEVKVCVWDVRDPKKSGKVLLCHVDKGKSEKTQTLSISPSAVPSHLLYHSGDAIGPCGKSCGTMGKRSDDYANLLTSGNLELIYSPNPFQSSFKLTFESDLNTPATIQIFSMTGSLVETVTTTGEFNEIELGKTLSAGVYNVKFTQGDHLKNFRVVKAMD